MDVLESLAEWTPGEPPLYRSLAGALRERIESGELRPGDKLPARHDLAAALHLSIYTVERAYNLLAREKLVRRGGQGVPILVAGLPAKPAAPVSQGIPAWSPPNQQPITGRLQEVWLGPEELVIRVQLGEGQGNSASASHAALARLNLAPGTPTSLYFDESSVTLAKGTARSA